MRTPSAETQRMLSAIAAQPSTVEQLIEVSGLSPKQVANRLKYLVDNGHVETSRRLNDKRRWVCVYVPSGTPMDSAPPAFNVKAKSKGLRRCLGCPATFQSTGPNNRLCHSCREKAKHASPYAN